MIVDFLRRVLAKKKKELALFGRAHVKGSVDLVFRYSPEHPNRKLRGQVKGYHELGSNLVVLRGRFMSAGLMAGGDNAGLFTVNRGLNESGGPNSGWVVRGMAVGSDGTAEADTDTALVAPIVNPVLTTHYHAITSIEYTAYPNTSVTFGYTFGASEPTGADNIREFALYTAAPLGFPVTTTPTGPAGGPYMVARKTHGLITKTSDFTMETLWTLEY